MVKKAGLPLKRAEGSKTPVPVKIVSEVGDTAARDKKWRAESDLRTMQEAEGIRKDKERMKEMKILAKEQMKNLKRIC